MENTLFHPEASGIMYISVILPLAVKNTFTYVVPSRLEPEIQFGVRVEVPFGKNKLYAALVIETNSATPTDYEAKPIIAVIDKIPIIDEIQLKFWQWLSSYYACTLGEVMNAALPGAFKMNSETRIVPSSVFDEYFDGLTDKEYMIAQALKHQKELTIKEVQNILQQKTVYPLIKNLLEKKIIFIKEEMQEKYKAKTITCVRLAEPYRSNSSKLDAAFKLCSRSNRQVEALMAYILLSKSQKSIRKQDIYEKASVDSAVLNALEKKKIFEFYDKTVSRLHVYEDQVEGVKELTEQQKTACAAIKASFDQKKVTLLHGVTGSGKTRVYVELIREHLQRNEQVLYLVPEIALTAQLTKRIQKVYGDAVAVYHSRLNGNERIELWKAVMNGKAIIMAPRSGLFLPFRNLKLVIVDESHDGSFKQFDPAPRYNGRDAAIYLSNLHGANIVLGTATPSIESSFNARTEKFALVEMKERFGGIQLPKIIIVDAKTEMQKKLMQSHFTSVLLNEMEETLKRGEQVILFKNRRGYAPILRCLVCNWKQECIHCDVSLTYHKYTNNMRCHYCGYNQRVLPACPKCGDTQLTLKGFGTEKIAEELQIFLPNARITRMDFDTVKSKHAHSSIINDFEEKRIDVLVGTQMVTKGLDFDNVGLVGVLNADQLWQFPDFRSSERAFQMLTQVSGRAGRKQAGKVIIQTYDPGHPIIREVLNYDYPGFYKRELQERQSFKYPPYTRIIKITVKHPKAQVLNEATRYFVSKLTERLGSRVLGPSLPYVPRVRNYYLLDVMIKLERNAKLLTFAKDSIEAAKVHMQSQKGCSSVRVVVDVDPQ